MKIYLHLSKYPTILPLMR